MVGMAGEMGRAGRRQAELYEMAMHDKLTGTWNRRYFELFLERVLQHAAQGRQQVTLLVFDIDNFKQYNDNFGHPAAMRFLSQPRRESNPWSVIMMSWPVSVATSSQ